ncbi:phosphatidylserine/phosphatidylglycerophosphate/cardiolipin synthase-like enzyme [Bradyrhizobium sp. CIR48]|uniref:phospholipase D-like domain-containing protein n=1 Tax=Bradyrhizobium sp. CIR48 TaxID=2663840 RepID=UPI001606AB24|nr:phospholipase D-like domain-containing protein [Bradyrhizobium sp. CIR48]MBB4429444.1 phosphatidylserine/phosphatidylglycerophosphate/cardiolipin synthase-like enzyme [Bradyrhizobium sp. CIR48]
MVTPVTVKAYASPGCVLLTFDWEDGADHPDFLGFAIERNPGYGRDGKPQFLFNKLDFVPLADDARSKGSDRAPIQKFNWWDGGINTDDQGKTFEYTVIPVLGTGPNDLKLQKGAAGKRKVAVPKPLQGQIATYFNRAVVSAQSFAKQKDKPLEKQMDWLANGLQNAIPDILEESDAFECAIYHLTDNRWVIPAFTSFEGRGSIVYFDKADDSKSRTAAHLIADERHNISIHKRDAISKLMHDKFIVFYKKKHEQAVLMGSTNFTPEAQTVQANLLHIIHSRELAALYAERANLLAKNIGKKDMEAPAWSDVTDVEDTKIRVFFLPEPGTQREFLDTVTEAVSKAKSSVLFCMFTASDKALMEAIFAKGDSPKHLIYGLLNSIDDPDKPTKKGEKRELPEIASTIFHRSQTNPDTLPYSAFGANAPRGFLPELRTIDTTRYDASVTKSKAKAAKKKSSVPPIHVHHKFIVIDGDTAAPTIYTGSPNFSKASENSNDENVLEIKGNAALAQAYVAEFMRLYNHYRARAIWNKTHEKKGAKPKPGSEADPLVLKQTRDEWVKDAYKKGTKASLARERGL